MSEPKKITTKMNIELARIETAVSLLASLPELTQEPKVGIAIEEIEEACKNLRQELLFLLGIASRL
jgi:hypothetical protein